MFDMNINDYRLNAYQKAKGESDKNEDFPKEQKVQSISSQIRHEAKPGHEALVRSPVFEHINRSLLTEQEKNQAFTKSVKTPQTKSSYTPPPTLPPEEARVAAKTGTYFKKQNATSEDVKAATRALTSRGLIKVPETEKKEGEKESLYRRVAKFLVVIGIDEAAKIIPHLTEEQTEKIIPEIASIQSVSPEEAREVLQEFESLIVRAREEGGVDTARAILTKAYGAKKAEEVIARSVQFPEGKPFDYLEDANASRIAILLSGEAEGTQALVLSQIEPKKAAEVINEMDTRTKKAVVLRLAKMKPVAPQVLEQVNKSLREKMLTQNTENSQNLDGRGVLAQILKRMDPVSEAAIIDTLSNQDPLLGADLRQRLFTEEDVLNSDDRFLQKKLHEMTDREISLLIRAKPTAFRGKILKNVSKNRAEAILWDEEVNEKVLKSDCEKITSRFYTVLRRAWEQGELRVVGRNDDEVYV